MKRILSLLAAALMLCLCLAAPALAATPPVAIGGSTYFDSQSGRFMYYAGNTQNLEVYCNVADGMVTSQAVSVRSSADTVLEIYYNGTKLEESSSGDFQQPGEYVVMYVGGDLSQRLFSFTIVSAVTNSLSSYAMPAGFELTAVTLNGNPTAFQRNFVSLSAEGVYEIQYRCAKTDIPYQLTVQTDYTGPTLALTGVAEGVARGPVDISDAAQAAVVNIYHNGEKIAKKAELTESGEYYIELFDEAGNKTTYDFTILVYFDGNSWLFILILLLSAIAVVVYLLHAKKNLRVR